VIRDQRRASSPDRFHPRSSAKSYLTFRLCVAGTAFVCLLLAGIAYPLTLTWLAKFLLLSQQPERADLILILGGDFYGPRALLGAELGKRGYAPRVLISGALYENRPEGEFAVRFLVERGYRRELFISFPRTTQSTIEEAIALCPELHRLGASKVLIVTSNYHSRRANLVFRLFCPGVRFRSIAAADRQFEVENWWKNPQYRGIFFSEWKKIIGTVFWKYPEHSLRRLWGAIKPHARTGVLTGRPWVRYAPVVYLKEGGHVASSGELVPKAAARPGAR
jgi:uncharacterized SAM-binding protein YcdF (DUF218 family)